MVGILNQEKNHKSNEQVDKAGIYSKYDSLL